MKKLMYAGTLGLFALTVNAQTNWQKGGNGNTPFGQPSTIGTNATWNAPLGFLTNGIQRMQMNGTVSNIVNGGANLPKDGFIGIGVPAGFYNGSGGQGPFSLLHLNGQNNLGTPQTGGYRDWMRFGIVSTHNQDLMFIGQRKNGNGNDITDAVIGWADNGSNGFPGPDNMTFNFLAGAQNGTDDLLGTANNGREIMRLTGYGNVGIGPRFNNTWQPQSTLHQHQENSAPSWMQITNQLSGGTANATAPTAITANDGLRWGINGLNTAFIYNQENNHLLFSTGHAVGANERMRITHIGAPGTTNPGGLAQDATRVSISHNPANPVTRPLSLLHLGYNTGGLSANPNSTDGWRPWMDIGIFTTNGTDNVYLGLKDENGPLGDRQDAILSWGDNQTSGFPPGNGPDNFRFIFTSTTAGTAGGTAPATGANGLEGMRLTPTTANGVYTGIGGDASANLYSGGTQNPNNTLEVNSWGATTAPGGSSGLRFTNLNTSSPTLANPGAGVLAVDANGDVIYVPGGTGSTLGNLCGAAVQNPLAGNWEVPMAGNNINFIMPSNSSSQITIGAPSCLVTPARFAVGNDNYGIGAAIQSQVNTSTQIIGLNAQSINNGNGNTIAVNAMATGNNSPNAIGVNSESGSNSGYNIAFNGNAFNGTTMSIAGNLDVLNSSSPLNIGHQTDINSGTNATANNFGVQSLVNSVGNANYGGFFAAIGGTSNYGIFAQGVGSTNQTPGGPAPIIGNYAAYFNGDVVRTGTDNFTSDQNLKQNIDTIANAMSIITQLKPKTFEYKQSDYPNMNLPSGKQYGLIAQDVQAVLPELVNNNIHPAVLDSVGNVVTPAVNYLSLEYQQLIGIMLRGMQQQQMQIKRQDSLIQVLTQSINTCCASNSTIRQGNTQLNQMDVELSDKDVVVLNQNVPNPFAEQTTITYNVPVSVGKAQLLFYNAEGKLIQTVDITTRGKGKINVFANDLSSGLYHYSLVVDGKVADSKKMVRE